MIDCGNLRHQAVDQPHVVTGIDVLKAHRAVHKHLGVGEIDPYEERDCYDNHQRNNVVAAGGVFRNLFAGHRRHSLGWKTT